MPSTDTAMDDADKIEAAAMVLSLPDWWTQFSFARTFDGKDVGHEHPHAACFCAVGALEAAGFPTNRLSEIEAHLENWKDIPWLGIWNDARDRTNTEVASFLFDCADELRARATKGG